MAGLSCVRIWAASCAIAIFGLCAGACGTEEPKYTTDARNPSTNPEPDRDTGPRCPAFNRAYRDAHKACTADEDCTLVPLQPTCNTLRVFAVAADELDAFLECAPDVELGRRCGRSALWRAEDGRAAGDPDGLSDVAARCIEGSCQSRVESRLCGDAGERCAPDAICVSRQATGGTLEHECMANPCLGEELSCSCAGTLCGMWDDQIRVCAIEQVGDSDLYCKIERR